MADKYASGGGEKRKAEGTSMGGRMRGAVKQGFGSRGGAPAAKKSTPSAMSPRGMYAKGTNKCKECGKSKSACKC